MVARLFSGLLTAVLLCLVPPAFAPLSAAQAANYAWQSAPQVSKRLQFRPLSHLAADRSADPGLRVAGKSRQHAAAPRAASRGSIVLGDRAGARKAVPITRGQELGLRFRPDEAESPYAQGSGLPAQSDGGASSTTDQSQFRPTQPRRRKTYEELQAEEWQQQAMPPLPYPPLPPAPMMPPTPVPPWPIW